MQAERLPKLSLAGGSRGIHHGRSQHKQASPTPRSFGTRPTAVDNHPSRPIPLPRTHIPRTTSELQLREDMAVAEWREMCMFHRLVEGMKERQQAQPQQQHVTSCYAIHRRDSQDSTSHLSSTRQLPKTATPHESPVFIDDSNRSAFLVEMLHRASELGDLDLTTETSTTGLTISSSSSKSATASNNKQQQQAQLVPGNEWSLKGFASSTMSATTPSFVHNDNDDEDECIFTLDM
mmetsp:Transcript_5765/g.16234  ORF Transcript_5765/g.16234 Transcript_5765/m.16234 type:complete len:235 (+) Transcript_5765:1-705(+)